MPYKEKEITSMMEVMKDSKATMFIGTTHTQPYRTHAYIDGDGEELMKVIRESFDNIPHIYEIIRNAVISKMVADGEAFTIPIKANNEDIN